MRDVQKRNEVHGKKREPRNNMPSRESKSQVSHFNTLLFPFLARVIKVQNLDEKSEAYEEEVDFPREIDAMLSLTLEFQRVR